MAAPHGGLAVELGLIGKTPGPAGEAGSIHADPVILALVRETYPDAEIEALVLNDSPIFVVRSGGKRLGVATTETSAWLAASDHVTCQPGNPAHPAKLTGAFREAADIEAAVGLGMTGRHRQAARPAARAEGGQWPRRRIRNPRNEFVDFKNRYDIFRA